MVSAQVPSLVRLYRSQPNGNKTQIAQARVEQLAPAGGASEGAASAVATPEKLLVINSPVVLNNDDVLLVSLEVDTTATIDASDCIWSIPLVTSQGSKTLGRAQFANPVLGDLALVGGVETFGSGYKVVEGAVRLSGKIYLDVQDNA